MSDNANKMGTDISMIQNAYQGFAKQNYTMLDNLKLGYGGTKAEMERLIAEASAMTDVQKELGITVEAGDMSFANIANAISVVQKNMGLMGTTASEASGTISGSTGSMKSAWENLVTGIADDNANFDVLVNNLVESIVGKDGEGGFLSNILPRIQTALDGIVTMVVSLTETLLPKIIEIGANLITNLASSISTNHFLIKYTTFWF
jgi:phage-related protein